MKYAPVFIPTLCRYEHLRRCIESLSRNKFSKETELYIALDFPLVDSHFMGYNKILKYIDEISGFKKVHIIKRQKNLGARKNSIEGRKIVFKKFDRVITSEDDNEFSMNFLEYMNLALERFNNDKNIYAICGHKHIESTDYNASHYLASNFLPWGFGTLRDNYKIIEYSNSELKSLLKDIFLVRKIRRINPIVYTCILSHIIRNTLMYGDMAVSLYMIINDLHCVYPCKTKVINHGHDGSGIHCAKEKNDLFLTQELDKDSDFVFADTAVIRLNEIISFDLDSKLLYEVKVLAKRFLIFTDLMKRIKNVLR